jgi:hypothetical protein
LGSTSTSFASTPKRKKQKDHVQHVTDEEHTEESIMSEEQQYSARDYYHDFVDSNQIYGDEPMATVEGVDLSGFRPRTPQPLSTEDDVAEDDIYASPVSIVSNNEEPAATGSKTGNNNRKKKDKKKPKGKRRVRTPISGQEHFPSQGPFLQQEEILLRNAYKAYAKEHQLTDYEMNSVIQDKNTSKNEKAKEMWNYFYDQLPNRKGISISKWCKREFHNWSKKKGQWTAEEDQSLAKLAIQYNHNWHDVGNALHRHPDACRSRWRDYVNVDKEKQQKGGWTDGEVERLNQIMKQCAEKMLAHDKEVGKAVYHLTYKNYLSEVNFSIVAKELGSRSRVQCFQKYQSISQKRSKSVSSSSSSVNGEGNGESPMKKRRVSRSPPKKEKKAPVQPTVSMASDVGGTDDESDYEETQRNASSKKRRKSSGQSKDRTDEVNVYSTPIPSINHTSIRTKNFRRPDRLIDED